jgi:DNA-binding MarR family transcriptional regulator
MFKLGIEVLDRAEPRLRELGLTGRQYAALAILDGDQPRSQHELGQLMGLRGQIIVGLADELERLGLVERRRSTDDRRRTEIVLTKAGARVLTEADAVGRDIERSALAVLNESQREAFLASVQRVMQSQWTPCESSYCDGA